MLHDILIGTVRIAFDAAHELTQTYEPLGGRSLRRKLSGAAHVQSNWAKWRTVISGSGRLPEGLGNLDPSASVSIYCMAPMSITETDTSILLPSARRTDWAPHAYAIVDGRMVPTGISIATNTATLTTVAGASHYTAVYYPILTCYCDKPTLTFSGRGTVAGWTLTAEEA
jgi:hypothetical protein